MVHVLPLFETAISFTEHLQFQHNSYTQTQTEGVYIVALRFDQN